MALWARFSESIYARIFKGECRLYVITFAGGDEPLQTAIPQKVIFGVVESKTTPIAGYPMSAWLLHHKSNAYDWFSKLSTYDWFVG